MTTGRLLSMDLVTTSSLKPMDNNVFRGFILESGKGFEFLPKVTAAVGCSCIWILFTVVEAS